MHCCNVATLNFCLFQSILGPAFHVVCLVWDMPSPTGSTANNIRKQLQQKYMSQLKHLCGVPSTTCQAVILVELNMHSLQHS